MPLSKKIASIVALIVIWEAACVKHNGNPVLATSPLQDTILPTPPGDTLTYLALGDSYTIGQSVSEYDRYPVQVVRNLRSAGFYYRDPDIIAVTGWTTGDLLNATPDTAPHPPYHAVTLLIGVNNQYQFRTQSEYRTQFTELLQRSIRLAGDNPSHVLVLSIPDYSVTPFAKGRDRAYIAAQIDSFNAINKEIAANYHTAWLDVTGESRKAANDPSLIAGDSLHFSGKEYAIWAEMMTPIMKTMH
ncbi:MAG TPA: SGNH/GDSL hydrolase family protein [Puia sp.]|nr:SGNH/GDSL hydrolase family protein [Puia sp.]